MEWDSFIRVIYNPTSIYFRQIEIIGRLKLICNLQVRDLTALGTKYDTSVKLLSMGSVYNLVSKDPSKGQDDDFSRPDWCQLEKQCFLFFVFLY